MEVGFWPCRRAGRRKPASGRTRQPLRTHTAVFRAWPLLLPHISVPGECERAKSTRRCGAAAAAATPQ